MPAGRMEMIFVRGLFVVMLALGSSTTLLAGFESARVFPASTTLWFHLSDTSEVASRMTSGTLGQSWKKVSESPKAYQALRKLGLDGFTILPWSDLSVLELMTLPKKEFAFGHFFEKDLRKWCMFIDADEDVLGVQIFCLNLEKKLMAEGCEKKEWKIGETTVIAFIANGECRSAFAERGSQYLFCNSVDMISEMTIRWINVTNDGLMNVPDFVSSVKSTDIERKVGVNLFLRGEYYYPKDMMMKSWLSLNIPYWLYPVIEAHCKSMLIAISFPPEQSKIEAEFQVDFRHNEGLEIFKHVAHASFSKADPFVPFDAISYAVVSADYWRIRAEDMNVYLREEPVAMRRIKQLADAKGMSVDDYLASGENEMKLLPQAYMCTTEGNAEVIVFKPSHDRETFMNLLSTHIPSDAIKGDGLDGSYWKVDEYSRFKIPPLLAGLYQPPPKFKGVRQGYYIESNSDRFFTELELQPEDTLHDSIPFKMVNKHLMARSTGNCFAVHYVDIGRFIESQIPKFKKTSIGVWIKLNGGDLLDELIPQIIERIGPIGGLVKKSTRGFRFEYFLLRK
jgi:hypothetical protein